MKKNDLQKAKKWLFLLALLLASSAMVAQQSIIRMYPVEETTDQDAKNFPEIDPNNGKAMALIKVSAPATMNCLGFALFDFGSIGYGIIKCKNGMTWVYAPEGASRVTIHHSAIGTEQNLDLGMALKSGMVYTMHLEPAKQIVQTVVETLDAGYLVINCNVEGASLKIGSNDPEIIISNSLRKSLPPGSYQYELAKEGYEPYIGRFTIKQEETEQLQVTMVSSVGTLNISSQPAGATILIDGKIRPEKTPALISGLNKGTHKVSITKELYKPVNNKEFSITAGQQTDLDVVLSSNFAVLSILASGDEQIFVDGVLIANGKLEKELEAAPHNIEVKKESHRPYKKTVTIVAGKDQTMEIPKLEPIYGKLNVEIVNNTNAKVYIDGVEKSGVVPCVIKDLLIGTRKVRVVPVDQEWQAYETTVDIVENKITHINPNLSEAPKFADLVISTTPSGANIYVNGNSRGKSPVTLTNLPVDGQQLTISAENQGYEKANVYHTLKRGNNPVEIALSKIKLGSLHITANDNFNDVYIDGVKQGYLSGKTLTVNNLTTGSHHVKIDGSTGHKPYETTIDISEGYNSLDARLSRKLWPKINDVTTFFEYRLSPPTSYGGVSLGFVKRWGGYGAFRMSNYATDGEILEETVANLRPSDYQGYEKSYQRMSVTGGLLFRVTSWLYLYAGGGYGQYSPQYSKKYTLPGEYGENKDIYHLVSPEKKIEGLELEYGAKLKLGPVALSAGHSLLPGNELSEFHFGAGLALKGIDYEEAFSGSRDRQEAFGQFHFKAGGAYTNEGNLLNYNTMHFNSSLAFPINAELGYVSDYENIYVGNIGIYSNIFTSDHFAFEYGLGYQYGEMPQREINQPYIHLGASIMFSGERWGGFNYAYHKGIFGNYKFDTHLLTYTMGSLPSTVVATIGLITVLVALAAENADEGGGGY